MALAASRRAPARRRRRLADHPIDFEPGSTRGLDAARDVGNAGFALGGFEGELLGLLATVVFFVGRGVFRSARRRGWPRASGSRRRA